MWLFLAFLIIPLLEIALFISVGDIIGLWPTLAVVILTAIIGTVLVRNQGLAALTHMRNTLERLDDPTEPLAHGAMILVSGALLVTPGFFTDALGFALLTPPVRRGLLSLLRKKVKIQTVNYGRPPQNAARPGYRPAANDTIDGDFIEVKAAQDPDKSKSGWTEH